MYITKRGVLVMIPVQILGVPVGSAQITKDGIVEIYMNGGVSAVGKEIREKLESGTVEGLTIGLLEQ